MRLPTTGARWALCALALALAASPALADKKKKPKVKPRTSVAECTSFEQLDRDDDSVDFVVANACEVQVACSVSWTVTCSPGTKRARKSQRAEAFTLATTESQVNNASAASCGNDGWAIDDVVWSCNPQ